MYSNLAYEIVNSSISKIKENIDSEKNISKLPKNELIIEEFERSEMILLGLFKIKILS